MPKRVTTEQFIQKTKEVHGDKYDYSKTKYINRVSKVIITCKKHGNFEQEAASHLRGANCFKCNGAIKKTTNDFIKTANKVHGNKYNYNKVEYIRATDKVTIICSLHGEFKQNPKAHLYGQSCLECVKEYRQENSVGWTSDNWQKVAENSKNFDSFKVYIIKCWSKDEEFYKIGKTFKTIENRFQSKKDLPYNYKLVASYEGTAKEMSELERQLQKENKKYKYIPKLKFSGRYECVKQICNH